MDSECRVEDLGVMSTANLWIQWRVVKDPRSGREAALGQAMHGGFVLVDPADGAPFLVGQEEELPYTWAVAQAPDGSIYQASVFSAAGDPFLLRWDGTGAQARVAARMTCRTVFTMDAAPDNRVYMPDYQTNSLHRFDPATGRVEQVCSFSAFDGHARNVCCAPDGFVYVLVSHHERPVLTAWHPDRGAPFAVPVPDGVPWATGTLIRDSDGRVWVSRQTAKNEGRDWRELRGGRGETAGTPNLTAAGRPLVFRDGGRIVDTRDREIVYEDPDGARKTIGVAWPEVPCRVFSVASGGGRIWGSTFIPLTLCSYEPATGSKVNYENPTATNGEIYSMAWAADKLFIAAYYGAHLSRFDPARPWRKGGEPDANPRLFGPMKDPPLLLHRPYGRALDGKGRVFFSALGGYGCEDSGISRIEPVSETVTRWVYPNTTLGTICYLPGEDRLLGGERRAGESAVRFTFFSPDTGEAVESLPVLEGEGMVTSWLYDGADRVYGVHNSRAAVFAFSLRERRIVAQLSDLGMGHHCYECLVFGPDNRIWGLTRECVFAVDRELTASERVANYPDHANGNFYRFGMVHGPDGHLYFPNGPHLMRVRTP